MHGGVAEARWRPHVTTLDVHFEGGGEEGGGRGRARSARSHVGAPSHFDAVYFLSSPAAAEASLKTPQNSANSVRRGCGAAAARRGRVSQRADASERHRGQTGTAQPAQPAAALQTSPERTRLLQKVPPSSAVCQLILGFLSGSEPQQPASTGAWTVQFHPEPRQVRWSQVGLSSGPFVGKLLN